MVKNRYGEMVERRQWLKELRAEKGLTVREAAAAMELSFSYYSDIENNRRSPSLAKAVKIAKFYSFDVAKFVS